MKWLMGVDEAGRGPLAGPVAVGAVLAPVQFDVKKEFPGVGDSKKLSEAKREELYELLVERQRRGDVRFIVSFSSHVLIDRKGITHAVRQGAYAGVRTLAPESGGVEIKLDGLLHAPDEYQQETIIRGDDLIPIISLASIAAKVERDRFMRQIAEVYPQYGFESHKGYGTKRHKDAIKQHGLCAIHRRSFCKIDTAKPSLVE